MNIKKLNELKKNKKGFTLIEIIVVIVILAVLLAVAVPSVLNYLDEADNAKLMANARAVMNSAQAEVVKEDVSSDGFLSGELDSVLGKIVTNCGITDTDLTAANLTLYTTVTSVDDKTAVVTGTLLKDEITGTGNVPANPKPELKAITMKLNGKLVTAVINGQIYVAE